MKNIILTKEIVQHIFTFLGLSAGNYSKIGITLPEFLTDKPVIIEYEDGATINHKTYAAHALLDSLDIKFLAIDLTTDGIFEAALVMRLNDLPIHALRLCYDSDEPSQFCVGADGKFLEADLIVQCNTLIGIEKLRSVGPRWERLAEFNELYAVALTICN